MKKELEKNQAAVFSLKTLTEYQEGAVVSRTVVDRTVGTITLFSFDAGQGLSEHTAPFDAVVQIIEGTAAITVDGSVYEIKEGEMIIMPANISHSLKAEVRFKMLLTMIRG